VVHPQNPLYSANNSANRTPNHSADRAGASVTFIDPVSNAARYSLCVRHQRTAECGNEYACNQNLSFHQVEPPF
jgi:hypothetical protein